MSRILDNSCLGVACAGLLLVMLGPCGSAHATGFKVLYSFQGGSDGSYPEAALISDNQGGFLGTAFGGGSTGCDLGCGTVYAVTRAGTLTVLHAFAGGSDGAHPSAALYRQANGTLFGTTSTGGKKLYGTVFKLATDGTEKVLFSFDAEDGEFPGSALITETGGGNLYGTTCCGGEAQGEGTVFELTANGKETVLYSFKPPPDGENPNAALLADKEGNFYSTASNGGSGGCGTVFEITQSGDENVIYSFQGNYNREAGRDGCNPGSNLIADKAGNLYGTTGGGGDTGTVFKVVPTTGAETILYTFQGGSDGRQPSSGLIADKAGNFYGVTYQGGGTGCGGYGCGTVYSLAPDGKETVLHAFSGSDGEFPEGNLIADAEGSLYGTTNEGGANGYGTVFIVTK